MRLLMTTQCGLPFIVDSDDLPKVENNKFLERITEIAIALECENLDGIHVQCIPVEGGRFVHTVYTLDGSFGERLLKFIAERMNAQKKLYSIDVALKIAKAIRESEVAK